MLPGNAVSILGIALALSLLVNLGLVYVALRPLSDLELTAARVSAGDLEARVAPSRLADRDMARVGTTLNTLLDHLTEDRARVRRLAAQVISAQDEERARVARELHDSTAQMLAAVMLQLGVAARENKSPALDERIATVRDMVAEALEEVRTPLAHHPSARARRPRARRRAGVAGAADARAGIARRRGVRRRRGADPAAGGSVLYRVAQESLRNAVRHAQARRVELWLRRHGDHGDARGGGRRPRLRRPSAPRNADRGWDCSPCGSAWGSSTARSRWRARPAAERASWRRCH